MFVFLLSTFVFNFMYSMFIYFLCIVSPSVYSCLFPIFAQVYSPLPPAIKPISENKCDIVSPPSKINLSTQSGHSTFRPPYVTRRSLKADSHIACRAHAAPMPFPCHALLLRV